MSKSVFISYSSVDRRHAFEIFRLLEEHDCDVWLDFFDIKPSQVLEQELADNVAEADVVCILLSPTSVASRWVLHEVELARQLKETGPRILALILRPCAIPDLLDNLVGIDLADGLADEAVQIRLLDAVLDRPRTDDALLLSAGQRSELAKQAQREQADEDSPTVAKQLGRVADQPIREVSVEIDQDTFPADQPTILELRLTLDPLWTEPMSFFFARYREGATWPEAFGFHEPPYTEYSQAARARVDCKLRWFDRVEELVPVRDSTDFERCLASFTLEFDGQSFRPGGRQPNLPQKFEIPSLRSLWDKDSHFEVVAHYPRTRTAERIDLDTTDIDIEVTARFKEHEPAHCCLFRSRHGSEESNLLRSESLARINNRIQREALLGLLPRSSPNASQHRGRQLMQALAANQEVAEEDRRFAARLCFGDAQLASLRGQHYDALQGYHKAAHLLEPIVRHGYPTYDEGVLMYRACANLLGYYLQHEKYERAQDFVNGVGIVAQRLLELDPDEPEYHRLWADALLRNAIVHAENGHPQQAAEELGESVEIWRRLHAELPSRERLIDAKKAVATAMGFAARWRIESELPLDEWQLELDPDGAIGDALKQAAIKRKEGPVWLQAIDPEGWPTVAYESPLLRYSLRVPERFSSKPELKATTMETEHVFRGPWPTEWLIVSVMDKASPGARMSDWVDSTMAITGFPVLEMTSAEGPKPELLEWVEEPSLDVIARRLGVDEAHGYSGIAKLPGDSPHLARIYILLARLDTFAWKITVSFETACLPATPAELVDSNDHVRAGAILGELRLG